jgi:hypothetical protein
LIEGPLPDLLDCRAVCDDIRQTAAARGLLLESGAFFLNSERRPVKFLLLRSADGGVNSPEREQEPEKCERVPAHLIVHGAQFLVWQVELRTQGQDRFPRACQNKQVSADHVGNEQTVHDCNPGRHRFAGRTERESLERCLHHEKGTQEEDGRSTSRDPGAPDRCHGATRERPSGPRQPCTP